jgi:hypothetical protein
MLPIRPLFSESHDPFEEISPSLNLQGGYGLANLVFSRIYQVVPAVIHLGHSVLSTFLMDMHLIHGRNGFLDLGRKFRLLVTWSMETEIWPTAELVLPPRT